MLNKPAALLVTAMALVWSSAGFAADITLDLAGFPNKTGGQVTGTDLEKPIPTEPNKQSIKLNNLKPGGTYSVDFFHNSGVKGADFTFVVNPAGTGIESITPVSSEVKIFKGFKPGDSTITLVTFPIIYNANSGQVGGFFVHGLCDQLPAESGPQTFKALPGRYTVDNLTNHAAGTEDFAFMVGNDGKPEPVDGSAEYLTFDGNKINIRATNVRFKIEASNPINYHPTHKPVNPPEPGTQDNVYEMDILTPVGGAGVNVWTFGNNKVEAGTALKPDGTKFLGTESGNDFVFAPRLRYSEADGFYFETTEGKSKSVWAESLGTNDDAVSALKVKVTATIQDAKPAPAPKPAE